MADFGPVVGEEFLALELGVAEDLGGKVGRAVDADFGEVDDVGSVGDRLHLDHPEVVVVSEKLGHPEVVDLLGQSLLSQAKIRVALVVIPGHAFEDLDGRAASHDASAGKPRG